jgi:hypothetical protein
VGDVKRDEQHLLLSPAHFLPPHSICSVATNIMQPPLSPARIAALFFAMMLAAYSPFWSGDQADQLAFAH